MPILGSTWVIGLFAINDQADAFAWIFTILNSLQVCVYNNDIIMIYVCEYIGFLYIFLLCFEARKG